MAVRAQWKGWLAFGEVSCPVSLYTAASTAERVTNTLNRKTGNRVRREFVDSDTGKAVEREMQFKGYEIDDGRYVILTPEEVASAVPKGGKTILIS